MRTARSACEAGKAQAQGESKKHTEKLRGGKGNALRKAGNEAGFRIGPAADTLEKISPKP